MRAVAQGLFGLVFLWTFVLALAGSGCALSRKHPISMPPTSTPVESPAAAVPEIASASGDSSSIPGQETPRKISQSKILTLTTGLHGDPCFEVDPSALEGETAMGPEMPRLSLQLKLDPAIVREMQCLEIETMNSEEEADLRPRNGFTRWLDGFHERLYYRMDNAVRRVDTMWLTEDIVPYKYELSTFKLKLLARAGGRSKTDSTDYKVKFRADLALPGLKRKVHFFLDNAGRDSLPGRDPMEQEDDTRLGARAVRSLRHSDLDLGGGARWRDSGPIGFAELEWRWSWNEVGGGKLHFKPRGFYYSDDGFGQSAALIWTRPVTERKIFQFRTAERSTEETDGFELEHTLRFAWLRSGRHRGWVMQMSMFPHYKNSDWLLDDSMVNMMWRGALYRKWIYYTLTPQVDFPREDDYRPMPSFRIGLEILMGGKADSLI